MTDDNIAAAALAADRRTRAIRLRVRGAHWSEIARQCGYPSTAAALRDVGEAMAEATQRAEETADSMRDTANLRLEHLLGETLDMLDVETPVRYDEDGNDITGDDRAVKLRAGGGGGRPAPRRVHREAERCGNADRRGERRVRHEDPDCGHRPFGSGVSVQTYAPYGGARDLLMSRDGEVLISGPAGTGKSLAALYKTHLTAMLVPGSRQVIVRQTHSSLTSSTLVTFEQQVIASAMAAGDVKWFGGSGRKPPAYEYANGSAILVGGLDQPGKMLSTEYDRIFVDEANQISVTAFETLLTRLRGRGATYKQIVLACNPDHPDHWAKKRADGGALRMIYSQHADNPYLVRRDGTKTADGVDYLGRLDKLTGVRRARYLEGRWVAAEGLVFDDWRDAVNTIKPFDVPKDWPLFLSVDFGFSNPFVCQWWRIDPDGRMYLTREIHQTQTLVEDHARRIKEIIEQNKDTEPRPYAVVCDHDAEDRATLTRHSGLATVAARKGVSRGVQLTQARMRPAGDGKPRLYVFRDATMGRDLTGEKQSRPHGYLAEINGYVWAVERGTDGIPKEAPVKLNDHSMDAGRYAVAHLDWHEDSKVGNPARPQTESRAATSAWSRPVGR